LITFQFGFYWRQPIQTKFFETAVDLQPQKKMATIDLTKHTMVTLVPDVPDRLWTKLDGAPSEWGVGDDTYIFTKHGDQACFVRKGLSPIGKDTRPTCLAAVNLYMFCDGRPCQTTFPGLATPDKSVIYLSRHGVGHGVPEIHGISDIAKPSRDGNPWLVSATIDTCDDWWRILSVPRPEWGVTDVYTCEPDMSETETRVFYKTSDTRQTSNHCLLVVASF